jgi:hypothetical protein
MRIIQLSFLLLLYWTSTISVQAQETAKKAALYWSEFSKKEFNGTKQGPIGVLNDVVYVAQDINYGDARILQYSEQMELLKDQPLHLDFDGSQNAFNELGEVFERAIFFHDRLYVITHFHNFPKKEVTFFVREYDPKTLLASNERQEIGTMYRQNMIIDARLHIEISPNENRILFYFDNFRSKHIESEWVYVSVFNEEMKAEWKELLVLPYETELFFVSEMAVDDQGDAYLLGMEYLDGEEKTEALKKKTCAVRPKLFFLRNKGSNQIEYDIDLGTDHFQHASIVMSQDQKLIVFGGYGDSNYYVSKGGSVRTAEAGSRSMRRSIGYFYQRIDPESQTVEHEKKEPFATEMYLKGLTGNAKTKMVKKIGKGNDVSFGDYDLRDVQLNSKGELFVTMEKVSISGDPAVYYFYKDILVFKLDGMGEMLWASSVPKQQYSINEIDYSSYVQCFSDDRLFFVFNDQIENCGNSLDAEIRQEKIGKATAITVCEVGQDGKVSRELLYEQTKEQSLVVPKISSAVSGKSLVLYCWGKGTLRFGHVVLKP